MLFVLNKSFDAEKLETCLLRIGPQGTILLIEDAVYVVKLNSRSATVLTNHQHSLTVCAIAPDLMLRGISKEEILDSVILVDYNGFVDLTIKNEGLQFWF